MFRPLTTTVLAAATVAVFAGQTGSQSPLEDCRAEPRDDEASLLLQLRSEELANSGGRSGENSLQAKKAVDKLFICDDEGKVLPILQAGIQKAGSSTLWDDLKLETSPLIADASRYTTCEKDDRCKEPHYFEHPLFHNRLKYNELWGDCSSPPQGLASDFTPNNAFLPALPAEMKAIYKDRYQDIIFAWGLREPARRMFSAFEMYTKKEHIAFDHEGCEGIIRRLLKISDLGYNNQSLPLWSGWLKEKVGNDPRPLLTLGFYYLHLRNWLDAGFLPSQFIIYPATVYLNNRDDLDANPVVEALRKKLGPNVLRKLTAWRDGKVANQGAPVSFEDACPSSVVEELNQKVIEPMNKKLMELLAEQVGNGMVLVGYTGKANDVDAVTEWMTSQWVF